jgi:hypothetical protein
MGIPPKEILGPSRIPGERERTDIWLDITCSLYFVKNLAAEPGLFLGHRHGHKYELSQPRNDLELQHEKQLRGLVEPGFPVEDDDISNDVPEVHNAYEQAVEADLERRWASLSKLPGPDGSVIDLFGEHVQGFRLARTIVPSLGQTPPINSLDDFLNFVSSSALRKGLTRAIELRKTRLPPYIANNITLLRTTRSDVELQPLDQSSAGVVCKDVLVPWNRHRTNLPWDLQPQFSERISMLEHVPELGLVVLASLCGRVALLTLTRPPSRHDGIRVRRAFRVACVLPRRGPEDRTLRPCVALHGIAISPVPDYRSPTATHASSAANVSGSTLLLRSPGYNKKPEMWRLILHYMDHTILMYDIARRSPEEDLMIF